MKVPCRLVFLPPSLAPIHLSRSPGLVYFGQLNWWTTRHHCLRSPATLSVESFFVPLTREQGKTYENMERGSLTPSLVLARRSEGNRFLHQGVWSEAPRVCRFLLSIFQLLPVAVPSVKVWRSCDEGVFLATGCLRFVAFVHYLEVKAIKRFSYCPCQGKSRRSTMLWGMSRSEQGPSGVTILLCNSFLDPTTGSKETGTSSSCVSWAPGVW